MWKEARVFFRLSLGYKPYSLPCQSSNINNVLHIEISLEKMTAVVRIHQLLNESSPINLLKL